LLVSLLAERTGVPAKAIAAFIAALQTKGEDDCPDHNVHPEA
jgi:hypothetical protein